MDIEGNRKSQKWTRKEMIGRLLWWFCGPFFRLSPKPLWGWRRFMLTSFGATIGKEVRIAPSAQIFIPWNLKIADWSSVGFDALIYNLGMVTIGENVTISQRAHLCAGTHDFRDATMPLIKSTITIGDSAWVCADAFIGPDIEISEGGIAAARAVVVKNVSAQTIVAGNPATPKGTR